LEAKKTKKREKERIKGMDQSKQGEGREILKGAHHCGRGTLEWDGKKGKEKADLAPS